MNRKERNVLKIAINMTLRFAVASPLVVVALVLDISIIGLPLGLPLGALLGKFMAKPMLDADFFNPKRVQERDQAELDAKNALDPDWWVRGI